MSPSSQCFPYINTKNLFHHYQDFDLADYFFSSDGLYLWLRSVIMRRNWMMISVRPVRGDKGFSFLAKYWKRSMNWTLLIYVNLFFELWSIQGQRYHTPYPPTKVTTYPWYILAFIQVNGLKDVGFRYSYFITEVQKESNVLHLQHSRKEQII